MEWQDLSDDSQRPKWMRQGTFKPCSCQKCFFCEYNLTTGTGPPKAPPRSPRTPSKSAQSTSSAASSVSSVFTSSSSHTHMRHKGRMVPLAPDHSKARMTIHDNVLNCVVCMREGRKRKKQMKEGDDEAGVKLMHVSRKGCPHLSCSMHSVCGEHWEKYDHGKT